jgi:hypothetical protein
MLPLKNKSGKCIPFFFSLQIPLLLPTALYLFLACSVVPIKARRALFKPLTQRMFRQTLFSIAYLRLTISSKHSLAEITGTWNLEPS